MRYICGYRNTRRDRNEEDEARTSRKDKRSHGVYLETSDNDSGDYPRNGLPCGVLIYESAVRTFDACYSAHIILYSVYLYDGVRQTHWS